MFDQFSMMLSTAILARLLAPYDFGLIAAATTAMGLLSMVSQLGLGSYIQVAREVSASIVATAFWLAVLLGTTLSVLAVLWSGALADAIGTPGAQTLIKIMAIGLVCSVVATVPRSLLLRRQRFGAMYGVQNLSTVCYISVALSLAAAGFAARSVAIAFAVNAVVRLVGYLVAARCWPRPSLNRAAVVAIAPLSIGSLLLTTAAYAAKNIDYWFVGHAGVPSVLGIYYIAYVAPSLVRVRLTTVVGEVGLTALAARADQLDAFKARFVQTLQAVLLLGLPTMAGIAVVSHDVLFVAFGENWVQGTGAMQILCAAAAADLVFQISCSALYALQRWVVVLAVYGSRILVAAVMLWLLIPSLEYEVLPAAATAMAISSVVSAVIVAILVMRKIELAPLRVLPLFVPTLLWTAVMAGMALTVQALLQQQAVGIRLIVTISSGVLACIGATFAIWPSRGADARRLVRRMAGWNRGPRELAPPSSPR